MDPAEQPSARFEIVEARDKQRVWKLSLFADAIVLAPPDAAARTITRAELPAAVDVDPLFAFGLLAVAGASKLFFKLDERTRDALIAWLGPPTRADLVAALKRRHNATALAVGALLLVSSLPLIIERAVDWPIFVWGASMLATWGLARIAPSRAWFLIDGVIHTAIAAWFVFGILNGDRHVAWAVLLLLAFLGFNFSMKQYRRFANMAA
jgi:hypothetical protein